jgi:hypothetical protein
MAHKHCRDIGGILAMPSAGNEIRILKRLLSLPDIPPLRRWIGPIFNWALNKWVWGPTGEDVSINDFPRDEMTDSSLSHFTCAAMDPLENYQWRPVSCIQKLHYICETQPEINTVADPRAYYEVPKKNRREKRHHSDFKKV